MTGLIVDGGAVFAQQRVAQNGSDSTATAGALVVAEKLSGTTRTGADVQNAVDAAAAANGLGTVSAEYTDAFGASIGAAVDAASAIPDAARGVHVSGSRTLPTSFARVIGVDTLTANADATVVAGALSGSCVQDEDGCALLPVTFPVTVSQCDGRGNFIGTDWHVGPPNPNDPTYDPNANYWDIVGAEDLPGGEFVNGDPSTMAILPLCKGAGGSAGAFGWLDLSSSIPTLAGEILGPLPDAVDIPDWFQTQPGNPNSVEDELLTHWHQPVLIPLYNNVCRQDPNLTGDICPAGQNQVDPVGNNTWYHIPTMAVFYIDQVLVQGNNKAACASPPGEPLVPVTTGTGFLGCLKGWFVNYIFSGPIDPNAEIDSQSAIGIQLIK